MSSNMILQALFIALLSLRAGAHDTNGMDMSMDGPMPLAMGEMLPYLHFTPGDNLWFQGWVPRSTGAMVGTCIGLFLLALVERSLAASRAMMETHWRRKAQIALAEKMKTHQHITVLRSIPPFIPAHDITRGILYIGQVALGFLFMLAVMTFQAGFLLTIVLGLGVGEILFGRFINTSAHL